MNAPLQRRNLRRHHGALAFVEAAAVQVEGDDEGDQVAVTVPGAEARLDPGALAGDVAVAAVDVGGVSRHNGAGETTIRAS